MTRMATDKQLDYILVLVRKLSGKSFAYLTQCPKTLSRLCDGMIDADRAGHFDFSVEEASAIIDVLQAKLHAQSH